MFSLATVVNDQRFEILISELGSKSNLARDDLLELIRQKKSKVGAGYLTDQGALFLVASDLGVSVNYDNDKPASLSHLAPDQKSITIIARIMSVGVPKVFTRKTDSRKGLITKLVVFDNSSQTTVSVWDAAVSKIIDNKLNVRPGDLIRMSDVYTRPGLDGHPVVNFGDKSKIEKAPEDFPEQKIDSLQKRTLTPSVLPDGGKMTVIQGKIKGEAKRTSFSRSDGSTSDYITFDITDETNNKSPIRAVIWNNANPAFEKLRDGEIVTLLNVKTRISTFHNNGGLEIHGDENTSVLEYFDETRKWMTEFVKGLTAQGVLLSNEEEKKTTSPEVLPFIARVISKRNPDSSDSRFHMLVVDSQKRKISVVLSGDATRNLEAISSDDVMLCRPETVDYSLLRANCVSANSITKVGSKRPDIPLSSTLFAKVEDLAEGSIVSLDLICLTDPVSREIQTKDGLVRRSEIHVADHTGEIKLYAWRNLSKLLEGFSIGDRIESRAVEVQSYEGKKFLILKNYSSVEKQSSTS